MFNQFSVFQHCIYRSTINYVLHYQNTRISKSLNITASLFLWLLQLEKQLFLNVRQDSVDKIRLECTVIANVRKKFTAQ